ncbi:MAG: 30S ribosomal protein S8 [bacterium]|nr:30S ribosomal protein S8 [bacterium]
MVTDPIADFITRLKNASMARQPSISVPFSKLKSAIAEVLLKEGFITGFKKRGKKVKKYLEVTLKYENGISEVRGVKRISKLGKRIYLGVKDIRAVKRGQGILVLSTPKGLMTDSEAKRAKVGGEALFSMW